MMDEGLKKLLNEDMEEYYNQTSGNPTEIKDKYQCNESDYYESRRLQREAVPLLISNKPYEALGFINQAIDFNPHDEENWIVKGMTLQQIAGNEKSLKFCSESYKSFKKALEYESNNKIIKNCIIDLILDWSFILYYWRKYAEALDKLDEYFILATNTTSFPYARALNLKGLLLSKRGDLNRALEYFDKAIETFPYQDVFKKNKEMCLEEINSLQKH